MLLYLLQYQEDLRTPLKHQDKKYLRKPNIISCFNGIPYEYRKEFHLEGRMWSWLSLLIEQYIK